MKTKGRQSRQSGTELSPAQIAAYRTYPAVDLDNSIAGMDVFLSHREFFRQVGNTHLVAATERAWWQDAVVMAGEPARSADQAQRKVAALDPALDGRAWLTAGEGYSAATAMIAAAVEAERRLWNLEKATRH